MAKKTSRKSPDWYYQRNNCKTCERSSAWLAAAGLEAGTIVNCRKEPVDAAAALVLARKATDIFATRGQKIVHINVARDRPDDETLRALIVGPSGNLRAPAIRFGRKLIVGFHPDLYREQLG